MRTNHLYKHAMFVDVCFRLRNITYRGPFKVKAKISWYLLKGLRPMNLHETVTIAREQIPHYREIKE